MTPWEIKAREFANCNCAYGCPCQFSGLPSNGDCHAAFAMQIDEGHYGDVRLDGLKAAGIFSWPGAIHEGHGKAQAFVDARADEQQRAAMLMIMSGQDTDPFATVFNVFASTVETMYDPVFTDIDFTVDVDGRTARIFVEGFIDTVGEPIRNPVNGEEARARINLPDGFEYTFAEIGSGKTRTQGPIPLAFDDTYGQFAFIHLNNHGIVRPSSYAPQ